MSVQVSVEIIAICILVLSAISLIVAGFAIWFFIVAGKSVSTLSRKAQPLISHATDTVKSVNYVAETAKVRVNEIMTRAEQTADNISKKVMVTSNMIQDSISPPLISLASLVTGVSKGIEVIAQARKRGGNGHASREP
jgi:uncharacterized protein YoxC